MQEFMDIFPTYTDFTTKINDYLTKDISTIFNTGLNSDFGAFMYRRLMNKYANSLPIYDFEEHFIRHFTDVINDNYRMWSLRYKLEVESFGYLNGDYSYDYKETVERDYLRDTNGNSEDSLAEGPATENYAGEYVNDYSNRQSKNNYNETHKDLENVKRGKTPNPFELSKRLQNMESIAKDIVKPFARLFVQYSNYCWYSEDGENVLY